MTPTRIRFLFLLLLVILTSPAADADAARPRVDIAPTRIVVEPRERSAELTIVNAFSDRGTYRVMLVSNRMKEGGGYQRLEEPLDPEFDPNEYVRVTPRQFSLETKGIQRIRLSVRRPADLPDGDYRFHVLVVRLANVDRPAEENLRDGQRALKLGSNLGVSIPVTVRQGAYDGDVEIENARFTDGAQPAVQMDLKRIGNRDIFGGLRVYWEPQSGERRLIGALNNINVFHETERRIATVRLRENPSGPGKLIVQYVEDYYDQGIIDEVAIQR